MEPLLKRCDGFSLLEVLVALAIVSLTLFLTFNINSNSISIERSVMDRLEALAEGEKLLNEELARFPDPGIRTGEIEGEGFSYTYKVQVTETPHPDALEVNVTLFYEVEGNSKSITFAGLAQR
ncbi:MAG: prepilin-type N-terminal cleavage/methylation domain-containing protein [Deltaproteobacteria bacterium]|nr:prepilin-type N-terminal cleavage/methylation domain-containing protein [Deltaproteobacteria bacterium]NIS76737.1 prepilin-type N-terminal cleavage/methylation domain-containing protein [Deltaproteobacteria bacterium]